MAQSVYTMHSTNGPTKIMKSELKNYKLIVENKIFFKLKVNEKKCQGNWKERGNFEEHTMTMIYKTVLKVLLELRKEY